MKKRDNLQVVENGWRLYNIGKEKEVRRPLGGRL
jgi:hypothetical protein